VSGKLTPYVKGQRVELTVLRNGKAVKHRRPKVARGGAFSLTISRRTPGTYAVRAVHRRTRAQGYARARSTRVHVLGADFRFGHGGAAVRLLQRGLRALHYPSPRSGVYDAATSRAVMAWRKVTGAPRVYTANRQVLFGVLDGEGAWRVRHPHDGHHVEADISKQVLVLIDGRKVVRVEHMSSGKPSTPTVMGRYRVYRKEPGTNSHGMVDSSYFIRGYAIHGYASVPTYNASHGCLRVPIPDARAIYDWVRMGDVVWVEP
jgi:peptidoglycan hydrolase-like protein with peptidoglycan-binding domain